jgi:hypothetical protein
MSILLRAVFPWPIIYRVQYSTSPSGKLGLVPKKPRYNLLAGETL